MTHGQGPLLLAAACAAALLYFGVLLGEAALLAWARRRIALVIHVNGTRGKTETTRLLAAIFRASGRRTVAKTTGTEPRLLCPDGTERRIPRLGPPNVREQRNLLLWAAFYGAEVVVAECMAVSPEAQAASTAFLQPSVLVVTNLRPDHGDAQGTPEEALGTFALGIPEGGLVVTGDAALLAPLQAAAGLRGARVCLAAPLEGTAARVAENAGVALAVALALGIDAQAAVAAMATCPADPGAFALRRMALPDGDLVVVDALSANDPVSTDLLFQRAEAELGHRGPRLLLYADRGDRSDRARVFADWIAAQAHRFDGLRVAGRMAPEPLRTLRRAFPGEDAEGRPRLQALAGLGDLAREAPGSVVFAMGNWKGYGPELAALAPPLEVA